MTDQELESRLALLGFVEQEMTDEWEAWVAAAAAPLVGVNTTIWRKQFSEGVALALYFDHQRRKWETMGFRGRLLSVWNRQPGPDAVWEIVQEELNDQRGA